MDFKVGIISKRLLCPEIKPGAFESIQNILAKSHL
jgi:hypothetical protein